MIKAKNAYNTLKVSFLDFLLQTRKVLLSRLVSLLSKAVSVYSFSMPKRPISALSPPRQPTAKDLANSDRPYQDGSRAPRNSMDSDFEAGAARRDHQNPEKWSAHAAKPEDIIMGNTEGNEQDAETFGSSLTSKLDAVKDGSRDLDRDKLGRNDKGEEGELGGEQDRTKKKRTQAEEGAGSGRYHNNLYY